jgi:hypothetical protein
VGLMTRYLLLFDSYGLVFCGAPSLLYMLLALASAVFLGPSPLGLATVFYCLRFETSLFVASYDSQGHGGGIRPASTRVELVNLIVLKITPRRRPHRKHRSCIVSRVLFLENVFTEPLFRNGLHNPILLRVRVCCGRYLATTAVYRVTA